MLSCSCLAQATTWMGTAVGGLVSAGEEVNHPIVNPELDSEPGMASEQARHQRRDLDPQHGKRPGRRPTRGSARLATAAPRDARV